MVDASIALYCTSWTNSNQETATGLITAVPSRATDIQGQAGSLGTTIAIAIKSYEGLSLTKREVSGSLRLARRSAVSAV